MTTADSLMLGVSVGAVVYLLWDVWRIRRREAEMRQRIREDRERNERLERQPMPAPETVTLCDEYGHARAMFTAWNDEQRLTVTLEALTLGGQLILRQERQHDR